MTNINKTLSIKPYEFKNNNDRNKLDFDDQVLQFVRDNKPEGTASEIFNQLRSLVPYAPPSLQQLNQALLYTNVALRSDPSYQDYTKITLDKYTCQMLGVNMLFNSMMNNLLLPKDESENDTF